MADESDVVFYKSTESSNRGGAITTSKVTNNKNQNFFSSTDLPQALLGSDRYRCFYIKNDNKTEILSNVVLYINSNTISEDDEIKIGLEPVGVGRSVSVDGVNDYINCGIETGLWNQSQTKFSASIWYYATDWTGVQYRNILGCSNGTDEVSLYSKTADPDKIILDVSGDGFTTSGQCKVTLPSTNSWHNYTIVYDSTLGSNRTKLYLDSVLGTITRDDNSGAVNQTSDPMLINAFRTSVLPLYVGKGFVKDFRYWAGTALNSTQVGNVYSSNASAPTPSYWLKMDEGSGNPKDNISGTKTGTLTNGAAWIKSPLFQVAQVISDIDVEPVGVEWTLAETYNQGLYVAKELRPGEWRAVWMWRKTTPTEQEAKNRAEFIIAFDPPKGSTGTGSGSGSGTGSDGGTPTPGPSVSDYAIAVVGDWSVSSDAQDTVNNILSFKDIQLTVDLGDNSYEDTGDKWASITKKLRENSREMKMVFGNHDRKEGTPQPELTNFYKSLMNLDNTYYEFTQNNFYFIVLDFYTDWSIGSTQYKWIKDKMQKAKNNSTITWRAFCFHEPMYTSPSHYNTNTKFATAYHPLMIANDFDFAFNGHNHNYFRSYPLTYNSGNVGSPTKVNAGQEPNYSSPDGQIFAQVGTGGKSSHRSFDSQSSFAAKQQDSNYGFLKISVSTSGRQVTGQFYKNNGQIYEKFTVVK